jgi:endoglycosylceramidase
MTYYMKKVAIVLLAGLLVWSCTNERLVPMPSKIKVKGDIFSDEYGRQVILNGINVVNKNKDDNYLYKGGSEFYKLLKQQGFNCIRLGVIWDGVEPQPGIYNEAYLKELDKRIAWAAENDLFVVLDMHQDLYSVKYADGAPEWATITDDKPHTTGAIWSDAYLLSEAVQTAFDHFWNNTPASDGIGIQDHYVALWQHVARRYAHHSNVIGYDIMNEPFAGSSAQLAMPALLNAYGTMMYQKHGVVMSDEQLALTWGDEQKRTEALKQLADEASYAAVIDALQEVNQQFESTHLQAMYQKVANAIRLVDQSSILFLEHSYFSNMGVRSSIQQVVLEDGTPDSQVAYAPHGYDLVTDTRDAAAASNERVNFIYRRIQEKGKELHMPVWMGEWGAYYNHSEDIIPVAQHAISLIEQYQFGQAYWSYDEGTEKLGYFQQAILRPYPVCTDGRLLNYRFERESGLFTMSWQEEGLTNAPTMLFIPDVKRLSIKELSFDAHIQELEHTEHGWLVIEPLGEKEKRSITFSLK